MLEVRNLSKEFKNTKGKFSKKVLVDVSFYVGKNEIVSITGKSGQGKSTIARILCGTVKVDNGIVIYEGKKIINEKQKYDTSIYPRIQIIPQQPFASLDPKQRIGDAIVEPILQNKLANNYSSAREEAKKLLKEVWLDETIIDRYPSQISGGQAQRVVIARAISVKPDILIADESTSMLDILSQAQVISIYKKLMKKGGLSMLFISHDKGLVKVFTNREYELNNGILNERRELKL